MNKYLKHLEVPENPLRAFQYPSRWLKTGIIILMMMMVMMMINTSTFGNR